MKIRRENRKTVSTALFDDKNYTENREGCKTLDDIVKAVLEGRVISMFEVVECILWVFYMNTPNSEDTQIFFTALEHLFSEKKLQKISRQNLDINIAALVFSNVAQSDLMITLLKQINSNDKLSTHSYVIIIISSTLCCQIL